jgi:hypothetical protein
LSHTVGGRNQVDLLIEYASDSRIKAIPLYLLYNYVDNYINNISYCNLNVTAEDYGCSIISARFLKDHFSLPSGNLKSNISFRDIHPFLASPWHVLACCFHLYDLNEALALLQMDNSDNIKLYDEIEILTDINWKLIQSKDMVKEESRASQQRRIKFEPKFRFIIN